MKGQGFDEVLNAVAYFERPERIAMIDILKNLEGKKVGIETPISTKAWHLKLKTAQHNAHTTKSVAKQTHWLPPRPRFS
jgi:hypothetical protein